MKVLYISLNSAVEPQLEYSCVQHVGCVNLSFAYVEGESLLMAMKDVALSSGRSVVPFTLLLLLAKTV